MSDFSYMMWGDHNWSYTAITGFGLIALIILAFEIWMLVDLIQNKKVTTNHKVGWAVGMFLIHPFVAIAYFIVSRMNAGRA